MFSYVDKSIRAQLEAEGMMVTLDRQSRVVPSDDASAFLSVLGPVPIPRLIGGEEASKVHKSSRHHALFCRPLRARTPGYGQAQ